MHPYSSFQDFPTNDGLQAHLVAVIRGDKGAYFSNYDIFTTPKDLRELKKDAVPSSFDWNNWGRRHNWQSVYESEVQSINVRVEAPM